jgi:hypothetical protein
VSCLERLAEKLPTTILVEGRRHGVLDDFTAILWLDRAYLDPDPRATPTFVDWFERELDAKLKRKIEAYFSLVLEQRRRVREGTRSRAVQ